VQHSWIGNQQVEGQAGRREVICPTTETALHAVSLLDAGQTASAVAAAREAGEGWSRLSFHERARHLLRLREVVLAEADSLAREIAREQGKPVAEAHAVEIFPVLESLKHLARHAGDLLREETVDSQLLLMAHKDCRLQYAPLGVVLVITPWNYPFAISLEGVATALAAGNTVVLKPAPATTSIGLRVGELACRAGLPPGVVNVVAIDDALAPDLVGNAEVAKVVFTGSVATGRQVMARAAENGTPVVLELGGKDPAVVCRDADIERSAAGIVWGAFLNAGQTCASVERVYVEEAVADRFVERVLAETTALRVGDPLDPATDIGPLTLLRQRQVVEEQVADAVARGGRVLVGGKRPDRPGFFYPPTVLVNVDHSMRVMREETFGPVLPIMRVPDLERAIALANDSEYGLTASAWTRDTRTARRLQQALRAGVVTVNDCVASHAEPTAPWGGVRHSGIGRAHGQAGLREMVQVKYVSLDSGHHRLLWWFPYGARFAALMATSNRALHAHSLWTRLLHLIRLLGFRRFWTRAQLLSILRNVDKLP
jgi:succinate-semialdehyde dehydrogenase/glutarate-semialdehyde dehydrogenase